MTFPVIPPIAALTLFALWALGLVLAIGAWRGAEVLAGRVRLNSFPSGTQHGSDMYWRLNRAHINTVENLPMFATLVLAGAYLQVQDLAFQVLPSLIFVARVVQSTIHIVSGSVLAVTLRFSAYVVQVAAMFVMAFCILTTTGAPGP